MGFGGHLKANTAVDVLIGPFVDSTDGATAETGLTISQADVLLSKNGQALTQKNDATSASHDSSGYYNCELDATDTNTEGTLVLCVSESGALPVRIDFTVLSQAAWDSLYGAKDSGYMDVNIKAISEDTTAADNAELAFDGTGFGFTNCTIPTVTTLTGHTAQTGDNFARLGAPAGASVSADVAAVKADTAAILTDTGTTLQNDITAILADTNELQTDLTNGGRLDLILDELTTQGDTNETKIDTIDANVDAILTDTGTTLQADITAIKAVTDVIPNAGALTDIDTGINNLETACITNAAGVDIAADIIAIKAETATIFADTNELQTDLTNGGRLDLLIDGILEDTGTTLPASIADIPTVAEFEARTLAAADYVVTTDTLAAVTTVTNLTNAPTNGDLTATMKASVNTEVDTALADIRLDHLVAVADADDPADNSIIAKLAASDGDWSGYDNSTDSLEAIRDRGDVDWSSGAAANPNMLLEAEIAAVNSQTEFTLATGSDVDNAYNDQAIVLYDDSNSDYPSIRVITDYVGATKTVTIDSGPDFTMGADDSVKIFVTAPGSSAPTVGQIRAEIDSNSSQLAAIVADTNELQGDWANGGRLDLILDELTTQGDTNESKIDIIDTNVDSILTDTGTTLQADITAIKAVTDVIPDAGALTAIDAGINNLETACITNAAGVDIAADIIALKAETDTILADTNEIQGDLTNGGRLDLILDELTTQGDTNESKIDTIDTTVDSILVDTGTTLQSDITAILADTNEIQAELADGGRTDLLIDAILEDTGTTIPASITGLNDLSAAEVNAEVVDVLNVDTFAEPGDEAPAATNTLSYKLSWLYKRFRNKFEVTATRAHIYDDAGTNKDHSAVISDDSTTFTEGEYGAGDA